MPLPIARCRTRSMLRVALLAVALAAPTARAAREPWCRTPALHGETIVFAAEGDLWLTTLEGGPARRLTTHPDEESHPAIDATGERIAFVAAYEGPSEVYVMPLAGGPPTRVTYGADRPEVAGWTPEGRVLYASRHASGLNDHRLFAIDPATGAELVLPLDAASAGDLRDDGALCFVRLPFQGSHTRAYRGGTARDVWLLAPGAEEAVRLTEDEGEDHDPRWWNDRVLFVSERDGTRNLWSIATGGDDLRQHTRFTGIDVREPSVSGRRVAFRRGADLWVHDLRTAESRKIPVTIASDLDQLRERWIEKPADWVTAAHLAPEGDRVAITARGEVFVAPVGETGGRIVRATAGDGARHRGARFDPRDSERLLLLTDVTGEVEVASLRADGYGEEEGITTDGAPFRLDWEVSPDGRWIAWHDKDFRLRVHDRDAGTTRTLDEAPLGDHDDLVFSPDSTHLAFTRPERNEMRRLFLVALESGAVTPVTSDRVIASAPAFSPEGDWLWFCSDRHFATLVGSPWGAYQPEPFLANRTVILGLPLEGPAESPFRPKDEIAREEARREKAEKKEESKDDDDEADGDDDSGDDEADADPDEGEEKDADADDTNPDSADWDLAGDLARRVVVAPIPPGTLGPLAVTAKHLYWIDRPLDPEAKPRLMALALEPEAKPKPTLVADEVTGFALTADRAHLLVRQSKRLLVGKADGAKLDPAKSAVRLDGWAFTIEPGVEFRQMLREAWRLERDYFYDPGLHGADWDAVWEKWSPLVDRVTTRDELADLMGQMVAELSALHTYVTPGDVRSGPTTIGQGHLGAACARDEAAGGWRIARILRGDADDPAARGPLERPGLEIAEGEVITHVDGRSTLAAGGIGALLRNTAGRPVRLRLAPRASAEAPRDVVVEPIGAGAHRDLLRDDWERERRAMTDSLGGGRVGYVHVRAMGGANYAEDFARHFYPLIDREGIVIDVRHNRGGNIDSWLLSRLMRRAWMYWQGRAGEPTWNMQQTFRGHLVVLCDERTASDGEAFCDGFRRLGLGQVYGVRTWGGEIWLSFSNLLVDRGIASAAEFGVYGPEGAWLIEGRGFEPDVVVENLPVATARGEDAQLRAAVAHLLERIAAEPRPVPAPPAYPTPAPGP